MTIDTPGGAATSPDPDAARQPSSPGRMGLRRAGRLLSFALAALLVGLLAYGLLSRAPDTSIDDALARSRPVAAPGFTLSLLTRGTPPSNLRSIVNRASADGRIDLRELRGTPVVLNFWASWCLPCREEAPRLQRAWRRHGSEGVLFLGLNQQDVREDARDFLAEFGQTFPNVRDPDNSTSRRWGVTGIPETFFIGRDGRVLGHVIGVVSTAQLEQEIATASAGRARAPRDGGEQRPTR